MQALKVNARNGLRIRRLPEVGSNALDAMPNGMTVYKLDDILWNENWFKIRADFSESYRVEGYSHRNFLTPILSEEINTQASPEEPQPPIESIEQDLYWVITKDPLNLRAAPSTSTQVITQLSPNTVVKRIEDASDLNWWKVEARTGNAPVEGYVWKEYLAAIAPRPAPNMDLSLLNDIPNAILRIKSFVGEAADELDETLLRQLNKIVAKYHINSTPRRFSHFMAQLGHESNFEVPEENLSYSAERLLDVFPSHFESLEHARQYERQKEKLANYVYSRIPALGNGNEASGDGYRFRGRGYIQLTGRYNYTDIGKRIGKDLVRNPDAVLDRETALEVAAAFWDRGNLNRLADADDVNAISFRVNGGQNGLAHRTQLLKRAKSIWGG